MNKISTYIIGLIILFLLLCEKESLNKDFSNPASASSYLKTTLTNPTSEPLSALGIVPYIIAGANKGGRTCEEVASVFNTSIDLCGDKIDYGTTDFFESFPEALNVTVNGNFISSNIDDCIQLGSKYYTVRAVIVKGSNAANVYFYPDGTSHDEKLAPLSKHTVSTSFWWMMDNGTFYLTYGGSNGPVNSFNQNEWCAVLVARTDLYAGSLKGLKTAVNSSNIPVYYSTLWRANILSNPTQVFTIPLYQL